MALIITEQQPKQDCSLKVTGWPIKDMGDSPSYSTSVPYNHINVKRFWSLRAEQQPAQDFALKVTGQILSYSNNTLRVAKSWLCENDNPSGISCTILYHCKTLSISNLPCESTNSFESACIVIVPFTRMFDYLHIKILNEFDFDLCRNMLN